MRVAGTSILFALVNMGSTTFRVLSTICISCESCTGNYFVTRPSTVFHRSFAQPSCLCFSLNNLRQFSWLVEQNLNLISAISLSAQLLNCLSWQPCIQENPADYTNYGGHGLRSTRFLAIRMSTQDLSLN